MIRYGKLGWTTSKIVDEDPGYGNAHIIEVLCEDASDAYLAYLQSIGVSYIFAGKEDLKAYILSESSTLEAAAEDFIHSFGYDYGVHVGIETCRFPVRTYGDMTFPAGMYEAVRVTIGNGAGHNFWCVLYPSLCYTDSIHASMPEGSKETLKSLIPENDYEALLRSGPQRSPSDEESSVKKSEQETVSLPTVKIRFRIAELFS